MVYMFQFGSKSLDKLLILLGFVLTTLFGYSHFIDGDVVQILDKAHLYVTQGIFTPYGNASTSGASGNIPGPFLTAVTAFPMKLWFSPWAALVVLALFHFVAYLMYRSVLKNFVSPFSLTALLVLFWLNPWRLSEVFLWNPGYIYLASLIHMYSAYHLSKKPSFWFSFLHAQALFLGLQIHPSFIILFFMTMILLWMKALKPNILGALAGIVFGLLTLLPYILEGLEDPSIFPKPGSGDGEGFLFFGLVYVYPMLKGFWYWILFGSSIFQTHVFHQLDFAWLKNPSAEMVLKVVWTGVKYLVGVFGVGLSFYVNYQFYKANKSKFNIFKYKMKSPKEWLAIYAIVAFVSSMIATAISPTLPIYWHLLYTWPMSLIPLLLAFDQFKAMPKWSLKTSRYLLVLIVYFSLTNFLAGVGSKKHDINKPFHDLYFEACQERCTMINLNK